MRIKILLFSVFVQLVIAFNVYADIVENDLQKILSKAKKYNNKMTFAQIKPFKIYTPGAENFVNYEKYGEFTNLGTDKYKFVIKDMDGLKKATGEGIYPNSKSVLDSPVYQKYNSEGKLKGIHWNFVHSQNYELDYYKWAAAAEDPGARLYYTALALENAGNYKRAVKAYYACLVFSPMSKGWTTYKTPWYIAPICISKIKYLTENHHDIGVKLIDCDITINNTYDLDFKNETFNINPGKLVAAKSKDFDREYVDLQKTGIKNVVGQGGVKIIQYNNNHFRLAVNDRPYIIRAMTYGPNKVGKKPDNKYNNIKDFSFDDENNNGLIDGAFEAWVDANRNNIQDADEKPVGDFALMKAMGVNTLRLYQANVLNKEFLKDGYEKFGFMYLVGDLIGMYTAESGASWQEGTDYSNLLHQKNMLASVKRTVEMFKDEQYVLMWVLGNENNYGWIGATNAHKNPEAYYKFVNECAKLIKSLDPQKRPVSISNGELLFIDYFAKYCSDVDVFGANIYRGTEGFGHVWEEAAKICAKPVLITEYGCPAYSKGWDDARAEEGQAKYHKGNWEDIERNLAGVKGGVGNALGGVIFEYSDEWWKAEGESDPYKHDSLRQSSGVWLDGYGYEEWFGICSLGNGKDSQFKRQLRKAYFMYRDLWKKYKQGINKDSLS
ncbi:MAG: hypothetical protein LBQ47_00795 [Endomicrobium sp.]|jgi:beta-glucuronidase|nr:hypothetical protein [Endomicrobium sp.]